MNKWFPITLLMLWVVAISETAPTKTGSKQANSPHDGNRLQSIKINLQIGFDLIQRKSGNPVLRIRNFEESEENNQRAIDAVRNEVKKSVSVRADSNSGTSESDDRKIKETINDDSSGDGSDRSDSDRDEVRSTKGLRPGDYEPEDDVNIHGKLEDNSDSDNNNKRRYKRSVGIFQMMKRKGKKFKNARKFQDFKHAKW